jgi:hypothetical protein
MWTPRQHFETDVRPPCEAYFADATSQWKAKAAAQAINNFAEWTCEYFKKNDPARLLGAKSAKQYRTIHAKACPAFRIVWDLADAAKHRFLTQRIDGRVVTTSTGAWADGVETLQIKPTGEHVDEVIGIAMDYWEQQI